MKLISHISNFNKKVENLKEWQWMLITFITCLIFMVAISVEIIWQPYLIAEDGKIFLREALYQGNTSILNYWGGYLGVLPRIFAILAINIGKKFNSMIAVTLVMKTCAILFSVLVVNYFNSKEFKGIIKSRILRLATSLLFMYIMANHRHLLYVSVMTHWWGGLLIFLTGYSFLNKRVPPLYILPAIILSILSSPSSIIMLIPMTYYIVCKLKENAKKDGKQLMIKNKKKVLVVLSIALAEIIEIVVILFLAKSVQTMTLENLTIENIFSVMQKSIVATIQCIPYIFTVGKLPETLNSNLVYLITGNLVIIILLWRYNKNNNLKLLICSLLSMVGLYFMIFYKQTNIKLPSMSFYNSIQSTVSVLLIIKCIYDDLKRIYGKSQKTFKVVMLLIICVLACRYSMNIYEPVYKYCANINKIEDQVDFSSNKIAIIGIGPNGRWKVHIPVKESYQGIEEVPPEPET